MQVSGAYEMAPWSLPLPGSRPRKPDKLLEDSRQLTIFKNTLHGGSIGLRNNHGRK